MGRQPWFLYYKSMYSQFYTLLAGLATKSNRVAYSRRILMTAASPAGRSPETVLTSQWLVRCRKVLAHV